MLQESKHAVKTAPTTSSPANVSTPVSPNQQIPPVLPPTSQAPIISSTNSNGGHLANAGMPTFNPAARDYIQGSKLPTPNLFKTPGPTIVQSPCGTSSQQMIISQPTAEEFPPYSFTQGPGQYEHHGEFGRADTFPPQGYCPGPTFPNPPYQGFRVQRHPYSPYYTTPPRYPPQPFMQQSESYFTDHPGTVPTPSFTQMPGILGSITRAVLFLFGRWITISLPESAERHLFLCSSDSYKPKGGDAKGVSLVDGL